MKLYTEESVIKLTKAAYTAGNNHNKFIFEIEFKDVNPIELPSEEKIEKEAIYFSDSHSIYDTAKDDTLYGFREGAKWVIEKIIKQK